MESLKQLFANFSLSAILPALIIAVGGIVIIRLLLVIVKNALEKSKLEKAAHKLVRSLIRVVLYGLLCLVVASKLGIDVTGVIAFASVLTLAISLAVQNALANVVGGFTILYTHPFSSGDYVEIAGQSGTVQEIGLTYTKLTTGDNKAVCIPNSAITAAQIVNYTVLGTRRVDIAVSASYSAPVEQVLNALRQAAQVDTILTDPAPFAALNSYDDSAISYILRVWSKSEDYWDTLYAINKRIKEVFDEQGIEMTYPHLNVHIQEK